MGHIGVRAEENWSVLLLPAPMHLPCSLHVYDPFL